jgi:hypothetical protein
LKSTQITHVEQLKNVIIMRTDDRLVLMIWQFNVVYAALIILSNSLAFCTKPPPIVQFVWTRFSARFVQHYLTKHLNSFNFGLNLFHKKK